MDNQEIFFILVLLTVISQTYQEDKTRPHIYPHVGNEGRYFLNNYTWLCYTEIKKLTRKLHWEFNSILDYDFWMQKGNEELNIALDRIYKLRGEKDVSRLKRPKNVLFFVGDGMSLTTITAARIYRGQQKKQRSGEELLLSWEEFPETALLKVNKSIWKTLFWTYPYYNLSLPHVYD